MDLLLQRGREALEAGDIDRAIEHFSALIDHAPDFAEGYNARATAYFQKGLYGPSLEDIEQTLARNPRHFGALSGLALILEELGIKDGALAAYRAVEEMYPAREGLGSGRTDAVTIAGRGLGRTVAAGRGMGGVMAETGMTDGVASREASGTLVQAPRATTAARRPMREIF